jgi:hypothetical protein
MKHLLDDILINDIKDIETIIIENQIGSLAIRMKAIQGMVSQYFIMRDKTNIVYVSSANKLKPFNLGKLNYYHKKKAGIKIMKEQELPTLDNGKWTDWFVKHKKKDDLADAYLQALYFVNS